MRHKRGYGKVTLELKWKGDRKNFFTFQIYKSISHQLGFPTPRIMILQIRDQNGSNGFLIDKTQKALEGSNGFI